MLKVLLATNNPGKLRELRSLLADLELQLVSPQALGVDLHVEETGSTYRENAALKAEAFAQASGLIALADDSGLEVEALEGAPGLFSARYSCQANASDADRRRYLLEQLAHHPQPWQAQFRCVVAIADQAGVTHYAEGVCPGQIIPTERGSHGFGYDPIFLLPEKNRTMAELPESEKNELSHRARAIQKARPVIKRLIAETT